MSLDERFNAATVRVRTFRKLPTNEELLQIYALYKQATLGDINDNNCQKPNILDVKAKAKYTAWKKQQNKIPDIAKQEYIELVEQLSAIYLQEI